MATSSDELFRHVWSQPETISALRKVPLIGDPDLLPYENASISFEEVKISQVAPLATYMVAGILDEINRLHNELFSLQISLLEVATPVQYSINGLLNEIFPPLIEIYEENGQVVSAIVDGLHRIWCAQNKGYETISCIVIRDVPKQFPLMALPLDWSEVKIVQDTPPTDKKRRFRFNTCEELASVVGHMTTKIPDTLDDCRYFLYRKLSALGSKGPRYAKDLG